MFHGTRNTVAILVGRRCVKVITLFHDSGERVGEVFEQPVL